MSSITNSAVAPAAEPRRKSSGPFGWLSAMPHPATVLEIAAGHVAAARWGHGSQLLSSTVELLPDGAVFPSITQPNVADSNILRAAIRRVLSRVPHQGQHSALLIPDPAVRVFLLPFDTFPRRTEEALPLLRWRLKKILPYDSEESAISWTRQQGREGKIEIVAAVARQKIVREYESAVEAEGLLPGVVQSATLATLPLLDEAGSALLVRWSAATLTTVIVRGDRLCVYRSTELRSGGALPPPQSVIDEVFPAVAFYLDTWSERVSRLYLAGFGAAEESMREALSREIGCPAAALGPADLPSDARSLVAQGLESLVGWQWNSAGL